ncbi:hypothetical protein Trydic_g21685 [Trypoxylus dichotomus]
MVLKLQWRPGKCVPRVSDSTIQKWFKKFSSRDLNLTDEVHSESPQFIDNEDLKQVVEENSSITCLEFPERFNDRIRVPPEANTLLDKIVQQHIPRRLAKPSILEPASGLTVYILVKYA